jgi:hypothetical protein
VQTSPSDIPVTTRVLKTEKYALVVCINETSQPVERNLFVGSHQLRIPVEEGRTRLLLVERESGKIIAKK